MDVPIAIRIECAKGEIMNAINKIEQQHRLPPCIMDGILSCILAEIRAEEGIALINETNTLICKKDEELIKAKEAAKKVLKDEQDNDKKE